jgi:uncharacterized protein
MSTKRELRFDGMELRADKSSGKMVISGRPVVYNSLSKDLGGFKEVLVPGCFDESLDDPEIYCAWNHDNSQVLGRISAGTLELSSDSVGLSMRCELPNSPLGQNAFESVRRKDVSKMSFGMYVLGDAWDVATDKRGQKFERRSVTRAQLFEISCVTTPAYDTSSVSARSLFPDGAPERKAASPVEVSERDLALAKARLELAKKIFLT